MAIPSRLSQFCSEVSGSPSPPAVSVDPLPLSQSPPNYARQESPFRKISVAQIRTAVTVTHRPSAYLQKGRYNALLASQAGLPVTIMIGRKPAERMKLVFHDGGKERELSGGNISRKTEGS